MKVLVTGCAGFIPSHLVDNLLERNYEVIGIDNFLRGSKDNLKNALKNPKFKFYEVNCTSATQLGQVFSQERYIHTIFHLAANSDIASSLKNPDIDFDNTFFTTYNVLMAMVKNDVKNIVFSSTSAVYGDTGTFKVDERHGPLMPTSHYGAAKLASEGFISSFTNCYDLKAWIIRFPNVVGGGRMTHGAIFDFVNKLTANPKELEVLGDGNQEKPYIHISELIEAITTIWLTSAYKINLYNVAPDSTTTVKNIAEWTAARFGKVNIIYTGGEIGWVGDVPKFAYNTRKLKEKLNFELKLTSDEAVKKAIGEIIDERKN